MQTRLLQKLIKKDSAVKQGSDIADVPVSIMWIFFGEWCRSSGIDRRMNILGL